MVFIPKISQSDLQKRTTDLDDLRKKHEDHVRKLDIKVKMLENESIVQKKALDTWANAHTDLTKEMILVKEALSVLQKWMASSSTRFDLLEKNLSHAVHAKLDLATEISKARKRLDDTKKP